MYELRNRKFSTPVVPVRTRRCRCLVCHEAVFQIKDSWGLMLLTDLNTATVKFRNIQYELFALC